MGFVDYECKILREWCSWGSQQLLAEYYGIAGVPDLPDQIFRFENLYYSWLAGFAIPVRTKTSVYVICTATGIREHTRIMDDQVVYVRYFST